LLSPEALFSGPAGGAYSTPPDPLAGFGGVGEVGKERE